MIQDTRPILRSHRIKSISIIGGFMDGLTITFVDGLNCVIGHRGTGKTTVLEFIRFVLDDFPRDDDGATKKRVEALVRSNLGDGRIRLTLETKDGLEYIVDRTASGQPLVLTADEKPTTLRINSTGVFNADIFSQNEVENIADSPQSQLALIDKFAAAEIAEINGKIAAVRTRLESNAKAILADRRQLDDLADEVGTLGSLEAKIRLLAAAQGPENAHELNIAHHQRALRGREEQAVKEINDIFSQYRDWLSDAVGGFSRCTDSVFDAAIVQGPNATLVARMQEILKATSVRLDGLLKQASEALDTGGLDFIDVAVELQHAQQQQELAYRALITKHNQAKGVATERADLEDKRNVLLAKERRKVELQKRLDELMLDRAGLAAQLQSLWAERFTLRQQIACWINEGAKSPIRVRIDQCGDTSDYQNLLAAWMKGTVGQYNPAARKIAQFVPPRDLQRLVTEKRSDELKAQADLGGTQMTKVMEALARPEVLLELDAVELADLPRIELLDGQEWKNSLELSTGQKCTTILPILLLDTDNPLLVDQPEDNLDNRYIYDTVVNAIHRVKQHRQIILITHNPNIPVLGEASAVYVLTSDGERSRLANQGTVDDCKTEIINLLEGGKEAFTRRKERYSY